MFCLGLRGGSSNSRAAFSFIELLIVFLLLTGLAGLLGYTLLGRLPGLRLRQGTELVAQAIVAAKGRAAEHNVRLRFRAPDHKTFRFEQQQATGDWAVERADQNLPADIVFEESSRRNADGQLLVTPRGFFELAPGSNQDPWLVLRNEQSGETRQIALQASGGLAVKKEVGK